MAGLELGRGPLGSAKKTHAHADRCAKRIDTYQHALLLLARELRSVAAFAATSPRELEQRKEEKKAPSDMLHLLLTPDRGGTAPPPFLALRTLGHCRRSTCRTRRDGRPRWRQTRAELASCGGVPKRCVVPMATLRVGGGLRQGDRALDDEPRVVHGRASHNLEAVGEDGVLLLGEVVGLAVDRDPVRMMHVAAYLLPVRHRHLEALTRRLCNDRDAVLSRREIDEV
jgi:hypothetical protein